MQYEVELKAILPQEKLKDILSLSQDWKKEEQDNFYYTDDNGVDVRTRRTITEEGLTLPYKVVKSKIAFKGGSMHEESREEIDVPTTDFDASNKLLNRLGFKIKSKWGRTRHEAYIEKYDATFCIDCNYGYGHLLEVEKVTKDEGEVQEFKAQIEAIIKELGLEVLPVEKLNAMYRYYLDNDSRWYDGKSYFSDTDWKRIEKYYLNK